MVHAHYLEDAEGRGYYVTAGHSVVSDGRLQVYMHPPSPIVAWLVPDQEAAERWIGVRLQALGHHSCGAMCHRSEELGLDHAAQGTSAAQP